ncbi:carbon-nitrogen hydrolase family protein [Aliiglaciecola sp. CAU 1673]|uniref:carbon-nitrogen hydrolase family protein n=1 Tax=Aliiglaciecola sp. CAU 1673 TaxID=3032595 RepID=UPI0023DCE36E|nr:carbon-nitrogen hydrolase family protein [Aliiglaciecola sp. CAU 1673]MDF2179122.1 carbon-nitrogen hydrolase family protein [Aliiglaciecola sp. CAU 1673]
MAKSSVNLVALQMVSTPEPSENLTWVEQQLQELSLDVPTLVVLPECFVCFGGGDKRLLDVAEEPGEGDIQSNLAKLARQYGVYLVAGTVPLLAAQADKFTASCLMYGPDGKQLAHYRKIHLFDVQVEDNTRSYLESRYTQAGNKVVVVDTPFGRVGLAVCYDVRFPGLFQAMGEVDIITLPAAFTKVTGKAHWQSLLSARAIEKQCYIVAPNQGGVHANGRETYGHSAILSPWGETLALIEEGPGMIMATTEPGELARIRQSMPVAQHNQFRSQLIEAG